MREADPQAQKAFIDLLHRICGGIRVSTRYPRQPKFPHVVVTRVGGATPNRITDAATMSVQVYAETEYEAEQVAGLIRQALRSESWKGMRLSGHRVRGWREYAAPQRFLDPDRENLVRFQYSGQLLISLLTNQ
ncbi:hypothetical protein HMPREF2657_09410 [Corynebacterium sp. HMSC072B08]|uniref:tail completion protein gp17 n=1 Tax=Corynebacterium TaxID=1716 RepID=UPI0008A97D8E|nr:DUF3168 domain-containing protein [Corynebacterium sp. HMSC072B08]OHQ65247.1 hypothetical protein HMPREF2657_09410 [Corynebacterium sp. HMSC072B08]